MKISTLTLTAALLGIFLLNAYASAANLAGTSWNLTGIQCTSGTSQMPKLEFDKDGFRGKYEYTVTFWENTRLTETRMTVKYDEKKAQEYLKQYKTARDYWAQQPDGESKTGKLQEIEKNVNWIERVKNGTSCRKAGYSSYSVEGNAYTVGSKISETSDCKFSPDNDTYEIKDLKIEGKTLTVKSKQSETNLGENCPPGSTYIWTFTRVN